MMAGGLIRKAPPPPGGLASSLVAALVVLVSIDMVLIVVPTLCYTGKKQLVWIHTDRGVKEMERRTEKEKVRGHQLKAVPKMSVEERARIGRCEQ